MSGLWHKLSLAGVLPGMDARMILRVKLFNRLCWILSAYLALRVGILIFFGNYTALLIYASPLLYYALIVPYLQKRGFFRVNIHISLGLGHLFVFLIGYFLFGGGFQNAVYILFLPLSFLPWIFFSTDERPTRIFWNVLNLILL